MTSISHALNDLAGTDIAMRAVNLPQPVQLPPLINFSVRLRRAPLAAQLAFATLMVVVALLLRTVLEPFVGTYRALFFLPAVMVAALVFGRGVGIYAGVLSTCAIVFFLTSPMHSFAVADARDGFAALAFLAVCTGVVLLIEPLQPLLVHSVERARQSELQLYELQHRMRNNLQLAAALLYTQARQSDEEARPALEAAADRIGNVMRVQDRLVQAQRSGEVDTKFLLATLCDDVRVTLVGLRPIAFKVDAASEQLASDRAVPLGLILNELLTNALKYAFPDDRHGSVEVRFTRDGEQFELCVSDDGVGIGAAKPRAGRKGGGLGATLVRAMASQLGGTVTSNSEGGGTTWILRFPAAPNNAAGW
ncbi:MAG: ATP-binding protein [Caulobacteraceae bacterium]